MSNMRYEYEGLIQELGEMKSLYNMPDDTLFKEFLSAQGATEEEIKKRFYNYVSKVSNLSKNLPKTNVDADINKATKDWDIVHNRRLEERKKSSQQKATLPKSRVMDSKKESNKFEVDLSYFDTAADSFKTGKVNDLSIFDQIFKDFVSKNPKTVENDKHKGSAQ